VANHSPFTIPPQAAGSHFTIHHSPFTIPPQAAGSHFTIHYSLFTIPPQAAGPHLMKKTFPLTHPKIKPARLADSIRAEISKYIKRERRKELPEGIDFWDFDCKVGADAASADEQHISAVSKAIGQVLEEGNDTVYVEILVKQATRSKKVEDGKIED